LADNLSSWIVQIASSDSQSAFKSLYKAYNKQVLRLAKAYVPSLVDAEEVVSDVFLSVWQNRKSLPGIANFEAYLFAIARNIAVGYYRAARVDTVELVESEYDMFFHNDSSPEAEMIAKEEIEALDRAVESLPDRCKMVFKLIREEQLAYKEVAEIMGISVKTVEVHLAVAVKKLREALNCRRKHFRQR
jgi:RNA polymerase sigma-70 factor (ECF subfamily)